MPNKRKYPTKGQDRLADILRLRKEFEALPANDRDARMDRALRAVGLWRLRSIEWIGWAFDAMHEGLGAPTPGDLYPQGQRALIAFFLDLPELAVPPQWRGMDWIATMLLPELHARLVSGLHALDHGETPPLLTAEKTGRHGMPYSLAQERLRAVKRVHFLIGKGYKRVKAECIVADASGVSENTLKSWEQRLLRKVFGPALKSKTVLARAAGELDTHLERDPDFGSRDGESIDASTLHLREELTKPTLAEAGKRYWTVLRAGKK